MQPAHDVELARRHAPRLLRLVEDLLQRAGVGALLLRHPGERAEDAGVPEDADVGGIDVLIGGEEDPVAVPAPVGVVGQGSQTEQVGGRVQSETVCRRESLARLHLFGDRGAARGRGGDAGSSSPDIVSPSDDGTNACPIYTGWKVAGQPLGRERLAAGKRLECDRYSSHLRTARVTLWPPKPNELESATSTFRSTLWLGAQSRSHSGSGLN